MKNEFSNEEMEKQADLMTKLNYINDKNAVFKENEGGFISLSYEDTEYDRVQVIRLFPFTKPDEFISIRTVEESSREIGVIRKLSDVSDETRKLLEKQLNIHYFTPVIQEVLDIKDEYGYAYFHVMTNRGECRFTINMGSNAVSRLSDSRLLITDLDENRFEIPDVFKLTPKEQRKLDLFL